MWLISIIIRISDRFISWLRNIRPNSRYTKNSILITCMWGISITELHCFSKVFINFNLFFSWFSLNTFTCIPFIFNFMSKPKHMTLFYMLSSCLSDIFNYSNRFLPKIPIIFDILFYNSCSRKFVYCKVRLNTVFCSIFRDYFRFPKNMVLRIKYPVIVSIFLLTTFIVSMGFHI